MYFRIKLTPKEYKEFILELINGLYSHGYRNLKDIYRILRNERSSLMEHISGSYKKFAQLIRKEFKIVDYTLHTIQKYERRKESIPPNNSTP